jgi:hypothetical protein
MYNYYLLFTLLGLSTIGIISTTTTIGLRLINIIRGLWKNQNNPTPPREVIPSQTPVIVKDIKNADITLCEIDSSNFVDKERVDVINSTKSHIIDLIKLLLVRSEKIVLPVIRSEKEMNDLVQLYLIEYSNLLKLITNRVNNLDRINKFIKHNRALLRARIEEDANILLKYTPIHILYKFPPEVMSMYDPFSSKERGPYGIGTTNKYEHESTYWIPIIDWIKNNKSTINRYRLAYIHLIKRCNSSTDMDSYIQQKRIDKVKKDAPDYNKYRTLNFQANLSYMKYLSENIVAMESIQKKKLSSVLVPIQSIQHYAKNFNSRDKILVNRYIHEKMKFELEKADLNQLHESKTTLLLSTELVSKRKLKVEKGINRCISPKGVGNEHRNKWFFIADIKNVYLAPTQEQIRQVLNMKHILNLDKLREDYMLNTTVVLKYDRNAEDRSKYTFVEMVY